MKLLPKEPTPEIIEAIGKGMFEDFYPSSAWNVRYKDGWLDSAKAAYAALYAALPEMMPEDYSKEQVDAALAKLREPGIETAHWARRAEVTVREVKP